MHPPDRPVLNAGNPARPADGRMVAGTSPEARLCRMEVAEIWRGRRSSKMRGRSLVSAMAIVFGCLGMARHAAPSTARGVAASQPAASPTTAPSASTSGAIAGSAGCRDCHAESHDPWAQSRHGLAMQPYSPAFAAKNLRPQKDAMMIGRHRYRAQIESDCGWVLEEGPEGTRKLPIAHVLGGKNVYYFLTPWERGRLQTLPVAYDVRRQQWYDTARSGVRHFPGQPQDEPLHWSDREYTFNTSCYRCHVSQLSTNYDVASDRYRTTWAEPGINCETCHGPCAEHVRVCREAPDGRQPEDLKIIRTTQFSGDQTDAMCAPCHARMTPLTNTFLPGERFFDHYDLVTLENADFYPDGRDLGENFTYTLWRLSPCVKAGRLHCTHCHTTNGQFRFTEDPDRSCMPCHSARVLDAAAHTHHKPDSAGSRCIACHMPQTWFARMLRSDHSLLPPTPAATLAFQSPNACNLCHTRRDAAWADSWVRQWRSRDFQAPILERARWIDSARRGDWTALPDILAYLLRPDRDEIYATSLVRLLRGCEDSRKWPILIRTLQDPSPLVRAAAAEALDAHLTPDTLPPMLKATRDEYRLVRVRAAATLAAAWRLDLAPNDRHALEAATAEYLEAMRCRPDDPQSYCSLGSFHADRGEYDDALTCYAQARRLDPRDITPLVNASLILNALGRNEQAEQSLRHALELDPESYPAHLNLGMLLGELRRIPEAEEAFRRALRLEPKSAVAAYNLGLIVVDRDSESGVALLRKAAQWQPDEPRYAFALAYHLDQCGAHEEAVAELRHLLDAHPTYTDAYTLLGDILIAQGRVNEAAELYRRASTDARLPAVAREAFAHKASLLPAP